MNEMNLTDKLLTLVLIFVFALTLSMQIPYNEIQKVSYKTSEVSACRFFYIETLGQKLAWELFAYPHCPRDAIDCMEGTCEIGAWRG